MGVRRPKTDLIAVLEAAYDLDETGGLERWGRGILEAFRPSMDRGLGVGAYLSDESRPFQELAGFGLPERWREAMVGVMTSNIGARLMQPPRPAVTGSEGIGLREWQAHAAMRPWHEMGVYDGAAIVASDGTGQLVTFFTPLPTVGRLGPKVTAQWERVAAHVSAGLRLRRRVGRAPSAVLEPSRGVVHAEGRARDRTTRDRLRDAAVAVDRARGRLRRQSEDEALALWRVLVAGEWSLVDQFDSDGRRFIVAHENEPNVRDPRALTLRERQVLAYTSMGHSLKLMAYELGVSVSAIATARKTAMRKLGLRSLTEVARFMTSRARAADAR